MKLVGFNIISDVFRARVSASNEYEKKVESCKEEEDSAKNELVLALTGLAKPVQDYAKDSSLMDDLFLIGHHVVRIDYGDNKLDFEQLEDVQSQFESLAAAWRRNIQVGYDVHEDFVKVFICVNHVL